ncbi:MAG: SDR family oxidoreductase [Ruminococcaceae bacterium]|nr:SDR family oxidoreductase [Oscillospiraceae bacterium]
MTKKVVLVTGGAKGIGADICRKLALKGYTVAIGYNTSRAEAEELKNDLISLGVDADIFKADISNPNEVKKMFSAIDNRFGSLYALVNNSGIAEQALFTDITDDMWDKMISTNLSGAFYCSREAVKRMLRNKEGKIVNITSMWGEVGASMEVHYSASKAGLIGLTKALAKEVGLSGITVNAVSPGVIKTDMLSEFTSQDLEILKDETPLNRIGEPTDVANAVAFLISSNADFITGQIIGVNGGFVI